MKFVPLAALCAPLFAISAAHSQPSISPPTSPLATTLSSGDIDIARSVESLGAQESPSADVAKAFYFGDKRAEWHGVRWGAGKAPGVRRLRVAFTRDVTVGSVLARGGGVLSVLKPGAAFPGNLGDDSQWIPAQRLSKSALSNAPALGEDYALWLLPPNTRTRALRFSHTPRPTEANFEAWLGGAIVLEQRFLNLAPWALATTARREEAAAKINNESNDGIWQSWSNGDEGAPQVLSEANPERALLTWPTKVSLRGLALLGHTVGGLREQIYTGPDNMHPREATENEWQTIVSRDDLTTPYPLSLGVDWLDFGKLVSTRAIRLLVTKTSEGGHPHLVGNTKNGKRTWISEVLALAPATPSPSQVLAPLRATIGASQAPIPIRFSIPDDGMVTLVIEDASGRRVRNLISEAPFKKGTHLIGWDGTDDVERDRDAARHGVFHIPPRLVAPGKYSVRGLWHRPLGLRYEFSIYNAGTPAWETQDRSGGWTTNHTPPSATLFVPAAQSLDGKDTMFLGSFVSEGGAGLAWTDLDGRKKGGRGWVGGNWTGAAYLARDEGASRVPNLALYVASPWSSDSNNNGRSGEIRLTGLSKAGDVTVLKLPFAPVISGGGVAGLGATESDWGAQMGGLAVRDGLVVLSMPLHNRIVFVDAALNRVRASAQVLEPRGVAFDSSGRLLVASQNKLLRFDLPAPLRPISLANRAAWKASASAQDAEVSKAFDADSETRWDTRGDQKKGAEFRLDMGAPQTFSTLKMRSNAPQDSPRALQVLASDDGQAFREIWRGEASPEWKTSGNSVISFAPQTARYLKFVLDADTGGVYWSINDLQVLLAPVPSESADLGAPQVLVSDLDEPQQIALRGDRIYVSQWGDSHNVQVLGADGQRLGSVGKKGKPVAGLYDPNRMNHPKGISLDGRGRLWVAEEDFQPKRVSAWNVSTPNGNPSATLWKAFYGPSRYGGGGTLDGSDPSKFYYDGMEFALDWKAGRDKITRVFHRPQPGELGVPDGYGTNGPPEFPIYFKNRKYFTNSFNANPTNGSSIAMLWKVDARGIARPVAAAGRANDWSLLKTDAMRSRWPEGADLNGDYNKGDGSNRAAFVWADANSDAQMQASEVEMTRAEVGGVVVDRDLSFLIARFDPESKQELSDKSAAVRLKPTVSASGVPTYSWKSLQVLAPGAQRPATSGGDQVLAGSDGWAMTTIGLKPFAPESISGAKNGRVMWQYPSLWPGLHASHEAPKPEEPGQVMGTTRLLGLPVTVKTSASSTSGKGAHGSEVLFFVNGNMGNMYAWTQDGLFVGQFFEDIRQGPNWAMPSAARGARLNGVSLHDENFWPSVTSTPDGRVYLVDGGRTSLVRIDNLDSIRRLPGQSINVSKDDLARSLDWTRGREEERQKSLGTPILNVPILAQSPNVDGDLGEWSALPGAWAAIDKSGVAANFNSDSKPFNIEGRVAIADGNLFAAWKTNDANWLRNSGEIPNAPFKTGGALDLMIGTNAGAPEDRDKPVAGDVRLLITQIAGKTRALIYRAVVPGTTAPVPFSSPWRTIKIDQVQDVSDQVLLTGKGGDFEIRVPLQVLGLDPKDGATIKGDIGALRGNGFQTLARLYWSNKATAITADVPSEAELTPRLWGKWSFTKGAQ